MNKNVKMLASGAVLAVFSMVMFFGLISNLASPQFMGWHKVVVEPGQSLWTICAYNCPNADTRDVVYVVCQRDHIAGDECIQPGQVLWVPSQA